MGAGWRRFAEQVRLSLLFTRWLPHISEIQPAKRSLLTHIMRAYNSEIFYIYIFQARQKWKLGDRDFQVTPNTRNEMMLKEAGEFAMHLKRCEKDIRALKNATEGTLFFSFHLYVNKATNNNPTPLPPNSHSATTTTFIQDSSSHQK